MSFKTLPGFLNMKCSGSPSGREKAVNQFDYVFLKKRKNFAMRRLLSLLEGSGCTSQTREC